MTCHYCGTANDVRPYGPNGAMICFDCMNENPEREFEARRQFASQLEASGPVAILDGSCRGPYPIEHFAIEADAEKGE